MTPMIDIVFLLLVFFVVAAAGQVQESLLPTELTAAGGIESDQPIERDPWIVEVWLRLRTDEIGQTIIDMNGTEYATVDALAAPLNALAELTPDNPVILDNGPNVPMRDVIAVYDLSRAAGFESINFAAKAEDVRR
ncbi:MAG: biopolymer transporter ExbD [Planctomycetaceae bacterium]|nr:biopolymer transporter ExbD [Planctomycetaceae bacterium]